MLLGCFCCMFWQHRQRLFHPKDKTHQHRLMWVMLSTELKNLQICSLVRLNNYCTDATPTPQVRIWSSSYTQKIRDTHLKKAMFIFWPHTTAHGRIHMPLIMQITTDPHEHQQSRSVTQHSTAVGFTLVNSKFKKTLR